MNLVIVESPAKAKTINKYLGSEFNVLASFGHVRDLPSKNGSVDPENNFAFEWEVSSTSKKHMKEIYDASADASTLYLATDPDREGEAIAWHIVELLNKKKLLKDKTVKRVVFSEITKNAVKNGIANPRDIDTDLVDAYLARRALDYLFGFNLSPVLWRKLPGAKSAGRVQSVALRLICERELAIESFEPDEYWKIKGNVKFEDGFNIEANLLSVEELKNYLQEQLRIAYDLKESQIEKIRPGLMREAERFFILQQIDNLWREHLQSMDSLRESVGLRGYGQKDPLIEYKNEGYDMFLEMMTNMRRNVIYSMFMFQPRTDADDKK